jgi:uncharacterized protein
MLKFLLLAVLVLWLLYSPGVRRLMRGLRADEPAGGTPASAKQGAAPAQPVAMVPCAHCGVHLPSSEALVDDAGRPFCSEAHRRAGPRRP